MPDEPKSTANSTSAETMHAPSVSHALEHGGDALAQQRPRAHKFDEHEPEEEHAAPAGSRHVPLASHTPPVHGDALAPQQWLPAHEPDAHASDEEHAAPAESRHAPLASHTPSHDDLLAQQCSPRHKPDAHGLLAAEQASPAASTHTPLESHVPGTRAAVGPVQS